ncbi:uncharacterized protein LOC129873522 isoform X2 [Solanum dulcamara]|uniref:uncharacterized protein LOC129873522 isoform X2 n=1 Tax=Solanum dulcamara TaxID=45834 RepID=UPI00248524E0|nr:uncharacterized protein LOC129873522 isoform X2 [Solanum dulcamara]
MERVDIPCWKFIIKLDKLRTFMSLEKAVCNHGFFMMAPNHWDPSTKSFSRPLRLADSITSAMTLISQHEDHLVIKVYGAAVLSLKDEGAIKVKRMLRLSDKDEQDVTCFHKLHPDAEAKGFGRLFRSPTLFEDVAKSLLLRFCPWKTSLDLAKGLCDVQLKKVMSKRKRPNINIGDFPSPEELAGFREEELKGKGKFGYRAADLINLAKQVVDGIIELSKFEIADEPSARIKLKINGAGPFTTHTIMMCTGYYHNIPIDTETLRHMKQFHRLNMRKRKKGSISLQIKDKIQQFYKIYHPFQSLAYWFELVNSYEIKLGKTLAELLPSEYHHATGNYEKKKKKKY